MQAGKVDVDPYLAPGTNKSDNRRGFTLLARPAQPTAQEIYKTVQSLSDPLGEQYVQPIADLHTTVLSVIPGSSAYANHAPILPDCISAVEAAVNSVGRTFEIEYRGIIASSDSLLAKGYPTTEVLQQLRDAILQNLVDLKLEDRFDRRYPMVAAHMTVCRFIQQPADMPALERALQGLKDHTFGLSPIRQLELVEQDWYMRTETLNRKRTFLLGLGEA